MPPRSTMPVGSAGSPWSGLQVAPRLGSSQGFARLRRGSAAFASPIEVHDLFDARRQRFATGNV
jgi:hypothetical protein